MVNPVNVQENIDRLKSSMERVKTDIKSLNEQVKFAKEELIRLEGCLIVFRGFADAGIKNVVDASQNTDKPSKHVDFTNEVHSHDSGDHSHDSGDHSHDSGDSLEALYAKYRTM